MTHAIYGFLTRHTPSGAEGALPALATAMFEAEYVPRLSDSGNNYWAPTALVGESGLVHYYDAETPDWIRKSTTESLLTAWDSMILLACEGAANVINHAVNLRPNMRGSEPLGPWRTLVEPPRDVGGIAGFVDDVYDRLPAEIAALYQSVAQAPRSPAIRSRLWRARWLAEILEDFADAAYGFGQDDVRQFPFAGILQPPEHAWRWWCLDSYPRSDLRPGRLRPLGEAVILMVDIHT